MLKKRGDPRMCSGDLTNCTITVQRTEEVLKIGPVHSISSRPWKGLESCQRLRIVRVRQDAVLALRSLPMDGERFVEKMTCGVRRRAAKSA